VKARSRSLKFNSDKFDFDSKLPREYNAGNCFYGRDVAEFIAKGLTDLGWPSTFFDEDWGWLVTSRNGAELPIEIAVYELSDRGENPRSGQTAWGLWLRAYGVKRPFASLRPRVEVDVPPALEAVIRELFATEAITLEDWDDGATSK
jgi:hypothetical protein